MFEFNQKVHIINKTAGSHFFNDMSKYGYEKFNTNPETYIGYYKRPWKDTKHHELWKNNSDCTSGDIFSKEDFFIVGYKLPEELFEM